MTALKLRRMIRGLTLMLALSACNRHPPVSSPIALHVAPAVAPPVPRVSSREVVGYLSSDALAGRGVGSSGLNEAGNYLAARMKLLGLRHAGGSSDFFEPFDMPLKVDVDPSTQLLLDDLPFTLAQDFTPLQPSGDGHFNGPVVFVGYGITRAGYDDYAGIDVRGKVVLAMRQEPRDPHGISRFAAAGKPWSQDAFLATKVRNAADHGAAAMVLVSPPASGGADTLARFQSQPGITPFAIPAVMATRRVADLMLTRAGEPSLADFTSAIDALARPKSVELPRIHISGNVSLNRVFTTVRNVIGILPGVGPMASQYVVIGAHYDHLGLGQLGHTLGPAGQVFHGADDNASGVAAVLETVDRLQSDPPLQRSVLVAFFTGEEEGLIGSAWFVKHPPVPLRSIVAMLNLDMVGRLKNGNLLLGGTGTAAGFTSVLRDAVAGLPVNTQDFEKGGLGPSDHMSFALQKIPVLFLFTGLHADYHRPTDTADKINYAGIDLISQIAARIVGELAALPRETYDDRSDDASTMAGLNGPGDQGTRHASLGVVPDFGSVNAVAGVLVSGVTPATPADRAGLKPGDRLIQFNAHPLNNLQDLSDALAESKPGDVVNLEYVRNQKVTTVKITLIARDAR